jgi:hypothetical protein
VPLYPTKTPVEVTAPVPQHMLAALTRLGYTGADREHATGRVA